MQAVLITLFATTGDPESIVLMSRPGNGEVRSQ